MKENKDRQKATMLHKIAAFLLRQGVLYLLGKYYRVRILPLHRN